MRGLSALLTAEQVRADFVGPHGAAYIELSELSATEHAELPEVWRELVSAPPESVAARISDQWTSHCPQFPLIAEFIRDHLLHLGLVRMQTPYHWVRALNHGPQPDDEVGTTVVLAYFFRDLTETFPFRMWFGYRPFGGELPPYWTSVLPIGGTLATSVHDGFRNQFDEVGLVTVGDMHTVAERWINVNDPDGEDLMILNEPGGTELPRSQWPDFDSLVVVAENTDALGWAVDVEKTDGSGWGDSYDNLAPIPDIAHAVQAMILSNVGVFVR